MPVALALLYRGTGSTACAHSRGRGHLAPAAPKSQGNTTIRSHTTQILVAAAKGNQGIKVFLNHTPYAVPLVLPLYGTPRPFSFLAILFGPLLITRRIPPRR